MPGTVAKDVTAARRNSRSGLMRRPAQSGAAGCRLKEEFSEALFTWQGLQHLNFRGRGGVVG